jgi:hypothetical protein
MIKRRLTFANVLSVIALFVALGGASYAATQLPKASVGTKQLKNGAVTGAKVKAGTLRASAFGAGQIPAGPAGPRGFQGERGPQGDKGDTGDRGLRGESVPQTLDVVTRYGPKVAFEGESAQRSYAACAPGEVATGGGYDSENTIPPSTGLRFYEMRPSEPLTLGVYPLPAAGEAAPGYLVYFENKNGAANFEMRAYALCVKTG